MSATEPTNRIAPLHPMTTTFGNLFCACCYGGCDCGCGSDCPLTEVVASA